MSLGLMSAARLVATVPSVCPACASVPPASSGPFNLGALRLVSQAPRQERDGLPRYPRPRHYERVGAVVLAQGAEPERRQRDLDLPQRESPVARDLARDGDGLLGVRADRDQTRDGGRGQPASNDQAHDGSSCSDGMGGTPQLPPRYGPRRRGATNMRRAAIPARRASAVAATKSGPEKPNPTLARRVGRSGELPSDRAP